MKKYETGQILIAVLGIFVFLMIITPSIIKWIQQETSWAVKDRKGAKSFNLTSAAIDRGAWKLQSTTTTWTTAAMGTPIAGYNFDVTYRDIAGGTYRIKFSSGPATSQVTVTAEGRDNSTNEVRAVASVYKNQTIYSPLMAGGMVSWSQGLGVYWGAIISQGNIQLMDDNVARRYFPRKFAKGTVIGTAANPRDINGLTPPNTDNIEWWSDYAGVPNVPLLDFATLRSSAQATGTLNVYGCACATAPQYTVDGAAVAGWDNRDTATCDGDGDTRLGSHTNHLGNSTRFYAARGLSPNQNYVWYWDGDVTLEGHGYNGTLATSLRGIIVVRGNLTLNSSGDMVYTANVPTNAWQEHQKLLINTYDTAAAGEYAADAGFHQTAATYALGTASTCEPGLGCGWTATVGVRGFVYVGQNLYIQNFADFNGAVWVNGNIVSAYNNPSAFCAIFYDDTLQVPALNVILLRQSWQEVSPSNTAWAP